MLPAVHLYLALKVDVTHLGDPALRGDGNRLPGDRRGGWEHRGSRLDAWVRGLPWSLRELAVHVPRGRRELDGRPPRRPPADDAEQRLQHLSHRRVATPGVHELVHRRDGPRDDLLRGLPRPGGGRRREQPIGVVGLRRRAPSGPLPPGDDGLRRLPRRSGEAGTLFVNFVIRETEKRGRSSSFSSVEKRGRSSSNIVIG